MQIFSVSQILLLVSTNEKNIYFINNLFSFPFLLKQKFKHRIQHYKKKYSKKQKKET